MDDREPTVRSREIGDFLRTATTKAGYSGGEMARKLDWSGARVSRLLAGKRGGSDTDVAAFLAVCGVKEKERTRIVAMCHEGKVQGWLQQYGARLPKQVKTLVDHETNASAISNFDPVLLPGLLQTGEYARATMVEAGTVPAAEIDDRVSARLARKELFSRDHPPNFTFYLHEFVLRLPVGGREVMSEQLHELLRMSVRTYVTLRVVPAAIGAHPAIAGQFQLMDIFDFKPIVYIDNETSCIFLEKPEEIAAYRDILRRLDGVALPEGQSREVIRKLAQMYAGGNPE